VAEKKKRPFLRGCLVGLVLGVVSGPVVFVAGLLLAYVAFPQPFTRLMSGQLKPPAITAGLLADYDWTVQTLDGEAFDLADTRGKAVFLHFWGPDCPQCLAELASLSALHDAVKDDDRIAFVAVARSDFEKLPDYAARGVATFPIYTYEGALPEPYAQRGVPISYLINPAGEVVFQQRGGAKWDDEAALNYLKLLAAEVEE